MRTTSQLHIADLAQLVERLICNQVVSGSSPLIGMGLWRESALVGSCFPKYTWYRPTFLAVRKIGWYDVVWIPSVWRK